MRHVIGSDAGGTKTVCLRAGGIVRAVPSLSEDVTRRLLEAAPRCSVTRLASEPAAGAVRLAVDERHGGAMIPVYL